MRKRDIWWSFDAEFQSMGFQIGSDLCTDLHCPKVSILRWLKSQTPGAAKLYIGATWAKSSLRFLFASELWGRPFDYSLLVCELILFFTKFRSFPSELPYRILNEDLTPVVERGLPALKVRLNLDDRSDKENYVEEASVIFEREGDEGKESYDFTNMIPLSIEVCLMSNGNVPDAGSTLRNLRMIEFWVISEQVHFIKTIIHY